MTMAMFNETRKGLTIMWDYKFSLITQLLGITLVFIGASFFVGNGEVTQDQLASSIIGFIITFYALNAIGDMSWSLVSEAQAGTLEQMYMSPAPPALIVLGRSMASFVSGTVQLVLIITVMIILFSIPFPLRWEALPVFIITIVGLLGFGYIIGGLTLVFKQVGPLANIVQNLMLFINGTFLPIELMPNGFATFARLFPSTQGIVVLRQVMLNNLSLAELWADGSLVYLTVHSFVFFAVGGVIYTWCDHLARKRGTLGQY